MIQVLLVIAFIATHLADALQPADDSLTPWMRTVLWLGPMLTLSTLFTISVVRRTHQLDATGNLFHAHKAFAAASRTRMLAVVIHIAAVLSVDPLGLVRTWTGDLLVVDELLATLPVLLVVIWTWWVMFAVERRLEEASLIGRLDRGEPIEMMPSRASAVWTHLRQDLLFIVIPVVLLMGMGELSGRLADGVLRAGSVDPSTPPAPNWTGHLPKTWLEGGGEQAAMFISGSVLLLGAGLVLALFPLAIRWLWDTKPLGPGPLRHIVESRLRSCRVRVSTVRVWRTNANSAISGGANAAVVGLVWPLRDLLLTDRLLESMPLGELDAVVAHEAAHLRQHHSTWLALAVLGVGSGVGLALGVWLGGTNDEPIWAGAGGIAAALASIVLVSRRFEWQADAHAARSLSRDGLEGPALLAAALQRVARLNGISPDKPSWRHGSINLRCRKLQRIANTRTDRLAIDRSVRTLRVAIVLFLALTAWLALSVGW